MLALSIIASYSIIVEVRQEMILRRKYKPLIGEKILSIHTKVLFIARENGHSA
jgi:hypothetical protein